MGALSSMEFGPKESRSSRMRGPGHCRLGLAAGSRFFAASLRPATPIARPAFAA